VNGRQNSHHDDDFVEAVNKTSAKLLQSACGITVWKFALDSFSRAAVSLKKFSKMCTSLLILRVDLANASQTKFFSTNTAVKSMHLMQAQ